MLTFLPMDQIQHLEADMQQSGYKPNTAQRLLAEEVIRFVHGEEGVAAALSATQVRILFHSSGVAVSLSKILEYDFAVHGNQDSSDCS